MENEIGLSTHIIISTNNTIIFNKNKIIAEYTYLFKKNNDKDYYLVLKNDKESLAIMNEQKLVNEDEFLIFKISFDKDKIYLANIFNGFFGNKKSLYYKTINNINYYLWRSLPKIKKDDEIDNNNEKVYLYHLEENSIFRLGNVKFIIREFHTQNNNQNANVNANRQTNLKGKLFTLILEPSKQDVCEICGKKDLGPDDPLVKLCLCEKYRHYKCMRDKFKEIVKIDENNGCIRFYLKTNCMYCKKYIPWNFMVKENNQYKLFELIDIPRNNEDEYILLEAFDFYINNMGYVKYIFYIKFRKPENNKNIETILIGGHWKKNNKYLYNKLVQIGGTYSISSEHALIDYDIEEKTLILRNISDTHNTLVLQEKFTLNKDDKNILLLELGNIKIETQLVEKNQFEKIEEKMKDNPKNPEEEIEIREKEEDHQK